MVGSVAPWTWTCLMLAWYSAPCPELAPNAYWEAGAAALLLGVRYGVDSVTHSWSWLCGEDAGSGKGSAAQATSGATKPCSAPG